MNDAKFQTRLLGISAPFGINIKEQHVPDVADYIRRELHDDAAGSAIVSVLKDLQRIRPYYFVSDESDQ
jgi:hypothetical protein